MLRLQIIDNILLTLRTFFINNGPKIDNLAPIWAFPDDKSNYNSRMVMKWTHNFQEHGWGAVLFFEVIHQIER